jgi:hypothetical protein
MSMCNKTPGWETALPSFFIAHINKNKWYNKKVFWLLPCCITTRASSASFLFLKSSGRGNL